MSGVLTSMRRQLEELQKPRTLHELHNRAGRVASDLVRDGFRQARSPEGKPWEPTTRRNPILVDTKALRDNIRWKADSRGLVIQTTGRANRYADFHMTGTRGRTRALDKRGRFRSDRSTNRLKRSASIRYVRGLPARPFLPTGTTIPRTWEPQLRRAFERYLTERFGSR